MLALRNRITRSARRLTETAAFDLAVRAVAREANVAEQAVRRAPPARDDASTLRAYAAYLAVAALGQSRRGVSRAAGLTEGAVRKACQRIEERRECGEIDRLLDELELNLMTDLEAA